MEIAHLLWGLNLGGIETMLVNIANEQTNQASVTIIIINDDINIELLSRLKPGIKVIKLNRRKNVWPLIKLNLLLIKKQFDIVHIHSKEIGMLLFPYMPKSKLVYTIHDTGVAKKYIIRPYALRVAISHSVANDVKKRLGIDTVVISNGIKADEFKKSKGKTGKLFKIVQLSRLHYQKKGQHILIEALSVLRKRGVNNISCDFIGLGDPAPLKELGVKFGIENINFLNGKEQSYIKAHLKDYDLLVQPSIYEGFGLTVTEGMAAKIPVLVSAIEGPMEIIDSGKYGYYFKVGDAEDCADQIEKIMHSDNRLMIENAFDRVNSIYNVEVTARQYIEEYRKIL